jgi:MFS family permease
MAIGRSPLAIGLKDSDSDRGASAAGRPPGGGDEGSARGRRPTGPTSELRGLRRTFSALHYRDFRILWIGAFVSTTGTWMQTVAQAWLVLSMTDSALLLGLDGFLATLPMILFSLLGGVAADRFERRKILILSQVLQMTFAFVLAALIFWDRVEVWHIFILSFLTGTAQSFGGPSYQALLPTLVSREDMSNAIAMNSIQFNLARVVGPVIAGLALAGLGAAACFALNGLSFLAVMLSLLVIRSSFIPAVHERQGVMEEMREGVRFMGREPALRQLTIFAFVGAFFGIPIVTLLPVVAKESLGLGATGYSFLLTAYGTGSVCGALIVAMLGHAKNKGRIAISLQIAFSVALLLFGMSRQPVLSGVFAFLAGACLIGVIAMISSLVQLATEEKMRGRVMSIFMMAFRGGMPLGNLFAGFVAERFSITVALVANAIALGFVALQALVRRVRVTRI